MSLNAHGEAAARVIPVGVFYMLANLAVWALYQSVNPGRAAGPALPAWWYVMLEAPFCWAVGRRSQSRGARLLASFTPTLVLLLVYWFLPHGVIS